MNKELLDTSSQNPGKKKACCKKLTGTRSLYLALSNSLGGLALEYLPPNSVTSAAAFEDHISI